jgi:hypothetical protein
MATWDDVLSYLRTNFRRAEDTGEILKIFANETQGGSQLVVVQREMIDSFPNEVWATISSPIAEAHCLDLHHVLRQAGERYVVGGLVRVGDSLVLRHSVPLSSMNLHEFVVPFHLVMNAAAELQRAFITGESS